MQTYFHKRSIFLRSIIINLAATRDNESIVKNTMKQKHKTRPQNSIHTDSQNRHIILNLAPISRGIFTADASTEKFRTRQLIRPGRIEFSNENGDRALSVFFFFFPSRLLPYRFRSEQYRHFFRCSNRIHTRYPIVFLLSEPAVPRALPSPFVSLYFVTLFPVVEHQPVPREYTR